MELFLDDFEVGQIFRSGEMRVEPEAVLRFATEFDPQPHHLDEKAAQASLFRGLAASGWHTAAITTRLLVDSEMRPSGGIVGGGIDELRWPRPVRPGDILHLMSEVLEVRTLKSDPGKGIVRLRTTTLNQRDQPVQIMIGNLFVKARL